jgi:hypothetical protein
MQNEILGALDLEDRQTVDITTIEEGMQHPIQVRVICRRTEGDLDLVGNLSESLCACGL